MIDKDQERIMRSLIKLAEKGRGFTSPNPVVGAAVVKNGKVLATGYHSVYGGPHAEVEALSKAGTRANGAELYITLEPCSTSGKTPPCTEAIKNSGIRKVIIGMIDPNPKHSGRGLRLLRNHGITVKQGILRDEIALQNEAFTKWVKTGHPFVLLKMAQTLDGKIATRTGKSRWISGKQAREWVHALRSQFDAVIVGTNTLKKDNPMLLAHGLNHKHQPWRVVLDDKKVSKPTMRVFSPGHPTILICPPEHESSFMKTFAKHAVLIIPVKLRKSGFDLDELLKRLGGFGFLSVLVEGGGELAWSFAMQGLVDKAAWVIAPKFIGGRAAKTSLEGDGFDDLTEAIDLEEKQLTFLGDDLLIEGYLRNRNFRVR